MNSRQHWLEQELRVFLETEGALAASYQWQQLQPLSASLLEGVARLPKQLLGAPLACALVCAQYGTSCERRAGAVMVW